MKAHTKLFLATITKSILELPIRECLVFWGVVLVLVVVATVPGVRYSMSIPLLCC